MLFTTGFSLCLLTVKPVGYLQRRRHSTPMILVIFISFPWIRMEWKKRDTDYMIRQDPRFSGSRGTWKPIKTKPGLLLIGIIHPILWATIAPTQKQNW